MTTKEIRIIMELSDKILKLIDNPPDCPRGDLQAITEAIISKAVQAGKEVV